MRRIVGLVSIGLIVLLVLLLLDAERRRGLDEADAQYFVRSLADSQFQYMRDQGVSSDQYVSAISRLAQQHPDDRLWQYYLVELKRVDKAPPPSK